MRVDLTGARPLPRATIHARAWLYGLGLGLALWFALLGLVVLVYAGLVLVFGARP